MGATVALVVLLALDRGAAIALVEDGEIGGKRLAPYGTPILQAALERSVEDLRDPALVESAHLVFDARLGWTTNPSFAADGVSYDAFGARTPPRTHGESTLEGRRRVLVFGCSYTHGTEVRDDEAWPHRVEVHDDALEVFNFGVPAYGLDQALLRLEDEVARLGADEVWLASMPSAGQRPSTHYRPFVRPWTPVPWLKPRMELDGDGAIVRLPTPVRSVAETLALYDEPGAFDAALAGNDPWYDAVRPAFRRGGVHRLFIGRLYWTWRVFRSGAERRGADGTGASLEPLHRAIVTQARARADAAGARFRFIVLPSAADLPAPLGDGGGFYPHLVSSLREDGVDVLDAAEVVMSVDGSSRWAPGGHYSPESNDAVARWLAESLAGVSADQR